MSRSYKKTPVYQDGYGLKSLYWYKRSANKKVRRTTEIDSGKSYRKIYDTWTSHDYVFRETLNEYKIELERDLKSCLIAYGSYDNFPNYYKKGLMIKILGYGKRFIIGNNYFSITLCV